ncbi:hypothetical protein AHAS_Ahas19G0098800 [Arachis hypogaea]
MAITAHFIDDDWNLQNRLVRFAYVPAPHTAEVLSDALVNSLRKLALDCRTRWNSTYLMLTSALPYREVFEHLRHRESLYKVVPSDDEWEMANELVDKLEVFYSVTELFSGTLYPTTNLYFPKVCEMRLTLNEWLLSPNEMIHRMTTNMISKFEKYWDQINEVMAVGAILDPRVKRRATNDDSSSFTLNVGHDEGSSKRKFNSIYLQFVEDTSEDCVAKTELDFYLEESVMVDKTNLEKFDILGY